MEARLNAQQASPAAYAAMIGLEMFVRKGSKLEPSLVQLVKVRASQINGCAYCIALVKSQFPPISPNPPAAFRASSSVFSIS